MAKAESPQPSGQSPRNGLSPRNGFSPRNGITPRNYSPRRQHVDAQKLAQDLEKSFEALRLHDVEVQRLYEYNRRMKKENLDEKERAQKSLHDNALKLEQQRREKVAAEAEATLERYNQQQIEEQQRKAEEERLKQQREAQAKAERDKKVKEEQESLKRAEEERAQVDAERQRQEKEKADADEAERQRKSAEAKRQDDERREREATQKAAAAETERQASEAQRQASEAQQQADAQAQRTAAAAATAEADNPERIHQEYIDLYYKIKAFKNDYWDRVREQAKQHRNPQIKEAIGEARRLIKTEVGKQSYGDRDVNRMAITKIKGCLTEFLQSPTPVVGTRVPVNDFLPTSLKLDDNNTTTITDRAAFLLCTLTQTVVKIFTSYVHGAPERAEPVGTMLASVFAQPDLQFSRSDGTTQSLFPIFLAKYHRVCPALFGITADQSTSAGKQKMGWALNPAPDDDTPKTTFVTDQTHYDRMTGLAIGFSSFGLRNFSATANKNPYPSTHFWKSLAQIINLPPDQVQPSHLCVLRYMFGHGGIYRFLLFFGSVGVAVLREAFVEFPKRLPEAMQRDSYANELKMYAETLGEKEHLHLV
ncbi:hypothetical protein PMZ80_001181 [Knufia obscura]|uniref:mRNA export factor GLE1 n=2 Tax=Knufia TaxID=430999 RepID=A0AAN8F2D0_9EURO|nr:hypothetical protein PMZ80_001181 [Knufia obscura]KAK5958756.1 hypothetical protein OHC33_000599 [Knufia fluminis]